MRENIVSKQECFVERYTIILFIFANRQYTTLFTWKKASSGDHKASFYTLTRKRELKAPKSFRRIFQVAWYKIDGWNAGFHHRIMFKQQTNFFQFRCACTTSFFSYRQRVRHRKYINNWKKSICSVYSFLLPPPNNSLLLSLKLSHFLAMPFFLYSATTPEKYFLLQNSLRFS